MNNIIIISGATATGKTALSLALAEKYNAEIVNFDSLLFYKELNIGTAKPSKEELNRIPHHLIDINSAKDPLNAADYSKLAKVKIDELHSRGKLPILVGGSGFYLRALLRGMYNSQAPSEQIIQKSNQLYDNLGIAPFIEILKEHDDHNFKQLHPNDHYRIRRAVEHFWSTGIPFSLAQKDHAKSHGLTQDWVIDHIYLLPEKLEHWKLIEKRTRNILKNGLVQEVENLLRSKILTGNERPMQSIGYKETLAYLNKELPDQEDLFEKIVISTRQLAKAQKTWFKKEEGKIIFNPLIGNNKILDSFTPSSFYF